MGRILGIIGEYNRFYNDIYTYMQQLRAKQSKLYNFIFLEFCPFIYYRSISLIEAKVPRQRKVYKMSLFALLIRDHRLIEMSIMKWIKINNNSQYVLPREKTSLSCKFNSTIAYNLTGKLRKF